ncbi:MAG: TetR/AcrR family transcriptional regulator [Gammaproteobacteria bacterium]|nr:TetR/AcrR family transcriptional regulator [Gammaproteobacteria bacterium]
MPNLHTDTPSAGSSRERLLAAAKHLIAEEGYERVSTAAIAREAGTSESQLVRYFGTKAGLLETIFDESWAPINPELTRLVAASTTAHEATIAILAAMINVCERDPDLAKLLFFESRRLRGDTAEVQLSKGFLDFSKLVVHLIERGQKDGSFSQALQPIAVCSALLGAAEGMIRDRLLATNQHQPPPFPQSQIRTIFEAIVTGLRP